TAVGYRSTEGTIDAPANRASPYALRVHIRIGREHALAADGTDLAPHRFDAGETIEADRQPRDIQKRLAANAAVGGKQKREETFSSAANPSWLKPEPSRAGRGVPRNNRRPHYCDDGLTSPDSVLTTAEDGLLIIPRT